MIGILVFVAGFIDSVAGGGGLISLPSVAMLTGEGVAAVATNKILGSASAIAALSIFWLHGHVRIRRSLVFILSVGIATLVGVKIGNGRISAFVTS